ncbi:MAG: diaminopimelate epimerase [Acidobacteria bacterium]|nr:diaminopimelate epimerase [Acidobacteriota bacterium]
MQFHKFQALGNDFLIARESDLRAVTDDLESFARRICDRHFGAGADGLEVVCDVHRHPHADFTIRLFNADGGETPISGNGTRCVGAWLYHTGAWTKPEVSIATGAGVKSLRLVERNDTRFLFETEMGLPRLNSEAIPVVLPQAQEFVIQQPLEVNGRTIRFTASSMGNPHCSLLLDQFGTTDFEQVDWRALGAALETHPAFPERTNVEFIRVLDRQNIEVRFWERGCGETLASGTGSCGAALAAMLNELTDRKVTVKTAAGELVVEWCDDGTVLQTGEACAVFAGEWLVDNTNQTPSMRESGAQPTDDEFALTQIGYFYSMPEAEMARELLANHDINALLREGSGFGIPGIMGGYVSVELYVAARDAERAIEIYDDYFAKKGELE